MNRDWTPFGISGAVVAITGAARGIGLESAKHFHELGATVALGDLDGDATAAAAASVGARAHGYELDVTDVDSFERFIASVTSEIGPIDVLVNNAGIMPAGPFLEERPEVIETQIDVNFRGPVNGTRLILPLMLERGHGHIVNVASMAGKFAVPGLAVYSGTKHAVVGFSAAVRDEISGSGVTISTVMPNVVNTELTSGLPTERTGMLSPAKVAAAIVESVDTRREEIAIPRWYGVWPAVQVILPTRLIHWLKGLLGVHRLLDKRRIDRSTRDRYDERIADSSSRERTRS